MDPGSAALGGAILGGAAGIGGSAISAKAMRHEGKRQRKFAKKMYQNRYKYTMADMKRSGINPILAAQQGLGGGSSPTAAQAQVPDYGRSASEGVSRGAGTALAVQMQKAQLANVVESTRKTKEEADLIAPRAALYERLESELAPLLDMIPNIKSAVEKYFPDAIGTGSDKANAEAQMSEQDKAWLKAYTDDQDVKNHLRNTAKKQSKRVITLSNPQSRGPLRKIERLMSRQRRR